MSGDNSFLKTISVLRFPLILLVVLIHAQLPGRYVSVSDYPAYTTLFSLATVVTSSAVPLFFLFSGYLFFFNVAALTPDVYVQKLKRRVWTLLIPYLFWNLVVLLRFWLTQTFAPGYADEGVKALADYTFTDWLRAFWDGYGGNPVCFQFWFLRDLMVLVVLSPLLYLVHKIKNGVGCFLCIVALLWLLGVPYGAGFRWSGIFFFATGAFGALKGADMIKPTQKLRTPAICYLVVYAIYTVVSLFTALRCPARVESVLSGLSVLSVACLILWAVSRRTEHRDIPDRSFLRDSTFFVYAAHPILLSPMRNIALRLLPDRDLSAVAVYLGTPVLTVLLLLAAFWLLKRWVPRFLSLVTGGRF